MIISINVEPKILANKFTINNYDCPILNLSMVGFNKNLNYNEPTKLILEHWSSLPCSTSSYECIDKILRIKFFKECDLLEYFSNMIDLNDIEVTLICWSQFDINYLKYRFKNLLYKDFKNAISIIVLQNLKKFKHNQNFNSAVRIHNISYEETCKHFGDYVNYGFEICMKQFLLLKKLGIDYFVSKEEKEKEDDKLIISEPTDDHILYIEI